MYIMNCYRCQAQIVNNAVVCGYCGTPVQRFNTQHNHNPPPYAPMHGVPRTDDAQSAAWAFFGWIMTHLTALVPLIMLCIWRRDYPKRSVSIFRGVLISFATNMVFLIMAGLFFVVAVSSADDYIAMIWMMLAFYSAISFISYSVWGGIICIVYACIRPK